MFVCLSYERSLSILECYKDEGHKFASLSLIIIIIITIMIMTLFRRQVYLAGQRPTNLGHHFYHSKVDGDLSHDRHTHINT